ncbi:54S ribosomal protein L24, mitochondrial [Schizosaccharomyces pombe]|uniref:Large ribosomal subunit protein bL28m n=1 Tax=Schizosaccharomyces pombe (strain 972 / ATCC 24843) TaxID=284812 RepID=RM24_SCHPO|nr:putative mitochondrial ribosomal protein subunit L28 [Schizosaccharomyces pombe]O60091.1 RecName: Full=Large ribosomal subunit protein bL28m; AltName: Full=54S ribosomal protein L24, mitochondrial; Flags: Precursor [Schizosaccharomyces pombe 972h-]CAA18428.1 mitochondrial ribosomal protein subunit L28 (predicted) [Schizosaccharomyces pombe]|eukprot:NP_001342721.1 putative mitochondrial ribosomal protein subunit L28 [Schizosaccharomyces pombe]
MASKLLRKLAYPTLPVKGKIYDPFSKFQQNLYGGSKTEAGNNKIPKFGHKTRRVWIPNGHSKWLYSNVLEEKFHLYVTSRVLRTIDKEGGLDEYLVKSTPSRLKSLGLRGVELRALVLHKLGAKNPILEKLPSDSGAQKRYLEKVKDVVLKLNRSKKLYQQIKSLVGKERSVNTSV